MISCHVCGRNNPRLFPEYAKFRRVTSDCKPWAAGGELGLCEACGCVQAIVDDKWRGEIAEIYRDYTIYHQANGNEQCIFEPVSGAALARSERLAAKLRTLPDLPQAGKLIDIGCGNGAFLRSFGRLFPDWTLTGLEWDDKYRSLVESIPGVKALLTGRIDEVPGMFDVISLVHSLEHMEDPLALLRRARSKLKPGGILFIQLPYYVENPFELFVTDHATHFDRNSAVSLLESAGFSVDLLETTWVPKELSIIARHLTTHRRPAPLPPAPALDEVLHWLGSVVDRAGEIARSSKNFGLFGTSIAGTWLFTEVAESVRFFVDEDTSRTGRMYLGLPVFHPSAVPQGGDVYVALAPIVSREVARRLRSAHTHYHEVPALHASGPAGRQ